jgi:hypothetical protein
MSGGGGGVIIIHSLVNSGTNNPLSEDDRCTLQEIADRSPAGCSREDWETIKKILKKHLRP